MITHNGNYIMLPMNANDTNMQKNSMYNARRQYLAPNQNMHHGKSLKLFKSGRASSGQSGLQLNEPQN